MEHGEGFTSEERAKLRRIMVDHERVMLTVFGDGNGDKGLLSRINGHFTREDTEREQREKIDARRSRIHFALLTAVLTLTVGILIAVSQMWLGGHKIVSVEKPISQSQPQDAGNSAAHTAATQ